MKVRERNRAFVKRLKNSDKRDWTVFFLSLLLAFSIWIIHNLSLSYSDYVDVRVSAISNIEGRMPESAAPVNLHAQCRTTGYNLLRLRWRYSRNDCRLNVAPEDLHSGPGDVFYITSRELQEYSPMIFGETTKVEYLFTDTLFFNFPKRVCRKVPVVFMSDISCRAQYTPDGAARLSPDSVTVYGEAWHLEKIDAVYTNPVVKTDVDRDIKGVVRLRKLKDVQLSDESVTYFAPVVRYTQLDGRFRLKLLNVPADKEAFLVPSDVEVSIICPFPLTSNPLETATFYVDYNDFLRSRGGHCLVKMGENEGRIIRWQSEPEMVECIVMDK